MAGRAIMLGCAGICLLMPQKSTQNSVLPHAICVFLWFGSPPCFNPRFLDPFGLHSSLKQRKPKSRRFWRRGMVVCMDIYPIAVRPHLGLVDGWLAMGHGSDIMSWISMLHQLTEDRCFFAFWQLFMLWRSTSWIFMDQAVFRNNAKGQHEYVWRSNLFIGLHYSAGESGFLQLEQGRADRGTERTECTQQGNSSGNPRGRSPIAHRSKTVRSSPSIATVVAGTRRWKEPKVWPVWWAGSQTEKNRFFSSFRIRAGQIETVSNPFLRTKPRECLIYIDWLSISKYFK